MGGSGLGLWWLSVNIAEAMVQDAALGAQDNAESAVPLYAEPPSKGLPITQLRTHHSYVDLDSGRYHSFPPLPRAWANLYLGWNGAFVMGFADAPMFLAKLLAPTVSGAHNGADDGTDEEEAAEQQRSTDRRGLFLYYRGVALWCHLRLLAHSRALHAAPLSRPRTSSGEPPVATTAGPPWLTEADWRSPELQLAWGRLNRVLSARYDARVQRGYAEALREAPPGGALHSSILLQLDRRAAMMAAWRQVHQLMQSWPDRRGWRPVARVLDEMQRWLFRWPRLVTILATARRHMLLHF